ncbi:MAG TPA: tetratricopeptide repeat protein, partial [Chitinophagales bacterium]|nr:tetratricopeptide repeat protein [Chitinophagales bacterium]
IPLAIHHELSIDDQINAKEISTEAKNEPHTFIEWLKLLDGNLQIQTTEPTKEPENWIEIPRYEVEQTLAQKKQIQQEEQKLFEPNFEEGEVDLFNEIDEEVSKVATDSIQFKQDMMTETLAKIYQKQGKYDKALEIYNTLRLKFPEKNAYFAALIEKLEKEK